MLFYLGIINIIIWKKVLKFFFIVCRAKVDENFATIGEYSSTAKNRRKRAVFYLRVVIEGIFFSEGKGVEWRSTYKSPVWRNPDPPANPYP